MAAVRLGVWWEEKSSVGDCVVDVVVAGWI